ncbi:hypothetical protein D9M70_566410 [compost metagenome]
MDQHTLPHTANRAVAGALAVAGLFLAGCTSPALTRTAVEHQPVRIEIHDSRGLLHGHPIAGEPLTAVPVCPSGNCTAALAYQWFARPEGQPAAAIPGATTKTYTPSAADVKRQLSVRVYPK